MGSDLFDPRRARSVEMQDQDYAPALDRWTGEHDNMEGTESDEPRDLGKHRSKGKSNSSVRRWKKEHTSRDQDESWGRERDHKDSEKDRKYRRKEDRDERGKDKVRDRARERDACTGKKEHTSRDQDESWVRERYHKDSEKDRKYRRNEDRDERDKDKVRDRARERDADREKHREREEDKERKDRVKEKDREKEREKELEKDGGRGHSKDSGKEKKMPKDRLDNSDGANNSENAMHLDKTEIAGSPPAASLGERIAKMREERLKKPSGGSEGASEVLAWVNRSRKIEDKINAEKQKALQLSRIFEEQDNIDDGESDDEGPAQQAMHDFGGVKVLHGIDKLLEGGAVVLTLKDQNILADGDINEEVDMLENVEIGEQKRRDDAYKAAKKKTGVYYDKFNDEPGSEKKMLPQYDDPIADEGVTLDSSGRIAGAAEKKLEELRKRLEGVSASNNVIDLTSTGKVSSDYYTEEEMTKFKKPKKKKSFRKKEKLDLNALEAEAKSAGLGSGDLGSRKDGKRQNLREEQERIEAEMRSNAYVAAHAKAEEASKALRQGQVHTIQTVEDENPVCGDDDDDELRKSLERVRKIALKKQNEERSATQFIIKLATATSTTNESTSDGQNVISGDQQENKVVFTEIEEFVWGFDQEERKPDSEDVFMEEDMVSSTSDQEMKDKYGGWTEVQENMKDEAPAEEDKGEVAPEETIREASVGKGLAGALKLMRDRGILKETVEWSGRNMDKKKSKLVGVSDDGGSKEIHIERTDEYGRILTPKEAFRLLSHKFHGKGPGKRKQEKRRRQYQEELKMRQMKNADTPSLSVERMRELQAKQQTPYLVLSGNVRPGQNSDPRSGFATVEKDLAGGLTPMLGDKKVEHFLNIKRKPEAGGCCSQKKCKT